MSITKLSKRFFLYLSNCKVLNSAAKRWGFHLGVSKVVAGVTVEQVIDVVRELNDKGLDCIIDHLGEFVVNKEEVDEATNACIEALEAIAKANVDCHVSVKLTKLGLDIDPSYCLENMYRIMDIAQKHEIFVCIDMENYSRYRATLDILNKLRKTYENVGSVIQAYLHCAHQDVKALRGVPLRLVKGAYHESKNVTYQDRSKIDRNFLLIIKEHLNSGTYTAVATHDHQIINQVKLFCDDYNIKRSQFEFQMLYGFRTDLQQQLVKEGYTVRVYVPYGEEWYGYYMRRLAERPQNVLFALRGLVWK